MQSLKTLLGLGGSKPTRRRAPKTGKRPGKAVARHAAAGARAGGGKRAARKPRARKRAVSSARVRTPTRSRSQRKTSDFFGLGDRIGQSLAAFVRLISPYGTAIAIGGAAALLVALWASGSFADIGRYVTSRTGLLLAHAGLTIDDVEVTGRQYTSKDVLSAALRLQSLNPAVTYDIEAARQRVEALDWVEKATITRQFPSTLRVYLVEKRPVAVWQLDGKLALIDRRGRVISHDHVEEFANLPQLVGPGAAAAGPELVDLLSRYPLIRSRLRAAIRIGGRRWTLRLDNGIDVQLPDQGEEDALKLLIKLDEKYRLLARRIKIIDMRDKDRLYLRLTTDETVTLDPKDNKI